MLLLPLHAAPALASHLYRYLSAGDYNKGQGNTGSYNDGTGNTGYKNIGAGNTGNENVGQVCWGGRLAALLSVLSCAMLLPAPCPLASCHCSPLPPPLFFRATPATRTSAAATPAMPTLARCAWAAATPQSVQKNTLCPPHYLQARLALTFLYPALQGNTGSQNQGQGNTGNKNSGAVRRLPLSSYISACKRLT